MLDKIKNFLINNIEDLNKKIVAVAYSGGIDSQVMLNIAYRLKEELKFNLIAIHINYNLRGEESKEDESFVRSVAEKYNLKIYVKEIEEGIYNGKNIQMEARKDRYDFFKELYDKRIYDYLFIAHNKDDFVETIIYRILKGAGTEVYKSVEKKNNYIIRPLLDFYRKDIENYAKENNLEYREDSSNKKNKYARNKIRNLIIPMLESVNLKSKENIIKFSRRVYLESKPLRNKVNNMYEKILIDRNVIDIEKIKDLKDIFLYKIIIKFLYRNDINATQKRAEEIIKIIKSSKKNIIIRMDDFNLVKEYNLLSIEALKNSDFNDFIEIEKDGVYDFCNKKVFIKTVKNKNLNYKDKLYIKFHYPIIIRRRKKADFLYAYPNGNKKYLRKIFIDLKIPSRIRDVIPVIESDDEISAVYLNPYGINRISERNAITEDDEYVMELDFI